MRREQPGSGAVRQAAQRRREVYALAALLLGVTVAAQTPAPPTFSKDVLPILQKNCQSCHRPGQIGPMSLLTYQQTKPWAKAIRAAVLERKMPPWHADRRYGHFLNDRSLSDAELKTLVTWSDTGALEGSAKEAPKP